MGFTIETGISAVTVLIQGLVSFFSPCVLPLAPLYLGYLAGGLDAGTRRGETEERPAGEDGSRRGGERLRLFIRVLFFTLGISGAFFILGLGASAAGNFFSGHRLLFARIGGALVVFFGLYQLGVFGSSRILGAEHRLPLRIEKMTMSPATAFLMGFTFSFAWTPCVGPALTSVLLMAGSADSSGKGFLLIAVYTLGFILPFLAAGIFTAGLLVWFQRHRNVVRYTVKIGGVLMVLTGLLMFTGKMNDLTGYLTGYLSAAGSGTEDTREEQQEDSRTAGGEEQQEDSRTAGGEEQQEDSTTAGGEDQQEESLSSGGEDQQDSGGGQTDEAQPVRAYEFVLEDQFGNTHTLEDYEGKVIFLNFWATWCGPCRNEMPDIQKLYEEYAAQGADAEVAVIGVAAPETGGEASAEEIAGFLEENGYTYPVLMDHTGEMFSFYGISAFPTTFMIDRQGNVYGYVSGQLTEEIMRSIIEQTLEG